MDMDTAPPAPGLACQIYGSHAWELAPSSVGVKDFNTPEYKAWVQAAWGKCLEKDAGTKYVSVWKDAGYRCYTAATCGATDGASSFTRSWAPAPCGTLTVAQPPQPQAPQAQVCPAKQLESLGNGFCSSGQIYGSHAWELASSSGGIKGFDTPEYEAWVQTAWKKCLEKDAETAFVSVWKDAGYRCYKATTCGPNGDSFTRSWAPAFSLKPDGYGHCSSGQIYGSHAWELAPSSVGVKDFNTPEYKAWVQAAWGKCLEKDAGTKYVSVWKDAGYRCYVAATCGATDGASSFTRSWAPAFSLKPDGYGHCSSGQIYGSHAWELAPSSVGVKDFNTPEYKAWVQAAWGKCLEKDAGTKYVSVWKDAGYRCYTAATCGATDGAGSFTRSWTSAALPC
ncbi:unnamed protein product [Durusdinium trenchii]|uniref:Uncharacterized protein n=1 Tax=Durusdinium trenchii TaxID=1381693 RepID=A0ABP0P389_9DINO